MVYEDKKKIKKKKKCKFLHLFQSCFFENEHFRDIKINKSLPHIRLVTVNSCNQLVILNKKILEIPEKNENYNNNLRQFNLFL